MTVYAIVITLVAVILIWKYISWKAAAITMILFCKEKFRDPDKNEIADYSKKAASKVFKRFKFKR